MYRRLLHRRVAKALETVYTQDLDAVCGQIAVHYERAGLAGQAIPYYQRAGQVASRVYANEEAITTFQQAITLLQASPRGRVSQESQWQEAALLYEDLGNVFERRGRLQEARQVYQGAMTSVPQQESLWQARLHRKSASTWQEASSDSEGRSHVNALQGYQEAERLLEQASVTSKTGWQQEWIALQLARLFPMRSSVEAMTSAIEKAQSVVEQYGTGEQRGRFSLAVCLRDVVRERYVVAEQTVSSCRYALAVVEQTGNRSLLGFAQFALGVCLLWSGHLDEAEEQMRAAMGVSEQIGDATLLSRCLTFLPFIFRHHRHVEEVRGVIARASTVPEASHIRIITGHRAWVAWRDGDLSQAESYGRILWEDRQGQQRSNSFYWTGLWPLIGVALLQERIAEAMDYTRVLLEPTQQPPPDMLRTLLEMAIHSWDAGQPEEARALLRQAVPLAEKMSYL
jgi:tetratricopeptide (TPR) repeat protein